MTSQEDTFWVLRSEGEQQTQYSAQGGNRPRKSLLRMLDEIDDLWTVHAQSQLGEEDGGMEACEV